MLTNKGKHNRFTLKKMHSMYFNENVVVWKAKITSRESTTMNM